MKIIFTCLVRLCVFVNKKVVFTNWRFPYIVLRRVELEQYFNFFIIPTGEWHTISGRFISVLAANISCRCAKSSTGISPHAHIGDGEIDLVLVRKTTRANYLHHLIKISEKTTDNVRWFFFLVYSWLFLLIRTQREGLKREGI